MMCRKEDVVILSYEPDNRYVVLGFPGRGSGLIELRNLHTGELKTVHHLAVIKRNPV